MTYLKKNVIVDLILKTPKGNIMTHDGHRERLKKRFLTSADSFEDHELLELILFYAIPRKNTNEIAHRLLDRFGSIKGIFDANIETIAEVDEIGKNTALYLKAIATILSRYEIEDKKNSEPLSSPAVLSSFLKSLFVGTQNECSYILLFNNSKKLITFEKLGEGFSMEHNLSVRKAMSCTLSSNATSVILVHNHPEGRAFPSSEDYQATTKLKALFDSIGVVLLEHFIVAEDKCTPILNPKLTNLYE